MKHTYEALRYWLNFVVKHGKEYMNGPATSFYCTELIFVFTNIGLRHKWFQLFDGFDEITELPEDPSDLGKLALCFDVKRITDDWQIIQVKLNDIMFAHFDMVHLNPLTDQEAHEALMAADPMYVSDLDAYFEVDNEFAFDPNEDLSLTPENNIYRHDPLPISTHDVVV